MDEKTLSWQVLPSESHNYVLFTLVLFLLSLFYNVQYTESYLTTFDLLSFFGLGMIFLYLPKTICNLVSRDSNRAWYASEEVLFLAILTILVALGWFVACEIILIVKYCLSAFGVVYAFLTLAKRLSILISVDTLTLLVLSLYFFYQIYNNGYHHPYFTELILSGQAHIDELYLMSLSQMLFNFSEISTGLNGLVSFSYHFGSNVVFASFANLLGVHVADFYNVGYILVFVPIFSKLSWQLISNLSLFFFNVKTPFIYFLLVLVLVFSYNKSVSIPFSSESILLSLIVSIPLLNLLFSHSLRLFAKPLFTAFIALITTAICYLKISTGIPIAIFFAFYYLRNSLLISIQSLVLIIVSAIFLYCIYMDVIPKTFFQHADVRTNAFLLGLSNLFKLSRGFMSYTIGALSVIIIFKYFSVAFSDYFDNLLKNDRYWYLGLLLISNISGYCLALYTSGNAGTVYNSFYAQYYFSCLLLIPFSYKLLLDFKVASVVKPLTVLVICCFSILSDAGDIMQSQYRFSELGNIELSASPGSELNRDLLKELRGLNEKSLKENYCIYISQNQNWYYKSQTHRPLGAAFVVPAYSGLPMIGGIDPSKYWVKRINGYSFGAYLGSQKIHNLEEAKQLARDQGFAKIIEFKAINDLLETQTYDL